MYGRRTHRIYSPIFGLNQNVPHLLLNKQATPDIDGVRFYNQRLQKMPLRAIEFTNSGTPVKVPDQTPADNEIMAIASTEDINGAITTIVMTKQHIYLWVEATKSYTDITPLSGISGDVNYWSVCDYNGTLVFVNGQNDGLFYLSGSAVLKLDTEFIDGDSSSTKNKIISAKSCWTYKNYLFLGGLTYYDGTTLTYAPNTIVSSNIGEGVSTGGFYQNVEGDSGFYVIEGKGTVTCAGVSGSEFIVFKSQSSRRFWFTGGTIPFNSDSLYENIGCSAPGSVVSGRAGNSLFFYGSDGNFYDHINGPIGRPIILEENEINPNALNKIRSAYMRDYHEIFWSVPAGAQIETNNRLLVYRDDGRWTKADIPVSAFSEYKRSSYATWDVSGYTSWNSVPESVKWNSSAQADSYIVPICGSYDGYVYNISGEHLDDGEEYSSYFTLSTDMAEKQSIDIIKRITQVYAYFDNIGVNDAVIYLHYKTNDEPNWRKAGQFYLNYNNSNATILRTRMATDIRGRRFLFKVSSVDNFSFVGIEFEYKVGGDR